MKRRQFMKRMVGGAAVSATALSTDRIAGANDRVRVALIGCGGRGREVAKLMRQVPGVEYAAACDVYDRQAAAAQQEAGPGCRTYHDFRKVLELKEVDAVHIATPDHWHAMVTVLACQAGKDVYVEKPLAHNIKEGRAMVNAARRYNRVVQAGTQHRSAPHYREAARIVQSGELGPVNFVRIWNYVNLSPDGMGHAADSDPPPCADWDFYLGPAPYVPFNKNRFLQTYRWFWDYAGGMVTDFGTHRFDSLHQIMGDDAPLAVTASGGRYVLRDGGETPDVVQVTYEYKNFTLSYEASMVNAHGCGGRTPGQKYYQMRGADDRPHGEAFFGTNGSLFSDRVGFEVYPEPKAAPGQRASLGAGTVYEGFRAQRHDVAGADATNLHVKNFMECVRSRQRPAADVEIGHRSTLVGHLGNIAFRTGRKIRWDSAKEEIIDDPAASELLERKARQPWNLI